MSERPEVVAFFLGDEIADDDPFRAVKLRARELCSPAYLAEQRAARLTEMVGLLGDECFDVAATFDAAREVLTAGEVDAAGYLAVVLAEVEHGR